jgi:hypothetical protein
METKPDIFFKVHELKTDPDAYNDIEYGLKPCTIRVNDRAFREGDYLILRKTKYSAEAMTKGGVGDLYPLVYTGRALMVKITHIQDGRGLASFYVCLSFKIIDRWPGSPDK